MLKNKVAVVTGGTRGIGYAVVKKFLENGAKVAILGSRQETVDKAMEKLKEEGVQGEVLGFCPDLTSPDEISKVFAEVKDTFGSLDILVNNAGVSARESIYTYNPDDFGKT
ncbi:MAG: SDR family NAD(P)-dependent oxidoreductase, partial [Lachnospiraceae bacterium]|nr:SDR family NAD(P)-dependent oxidoreductase [Lachnospiraceae bacterium]